MSYVKNLTEQKTSISIKNKSEHVAQSYAAGCWNSGSNAKNETTKAIKMLSNSKQSYAKQHLC